MKLDMHAVRGILLSNYGPKANEWTTQVIDTLDQDISLVHLSLELPNSAVRPPIPFPCPFHLPLPLRSPSWWILLDDSLAPFALSDKNMNLED